MTTRLPGTHSLAFGQFFGNPEFERELSGFSLAKLAAVRSADDVPEHVHECAHLVLVLGGRYLTSASPVERGGAPALVYNPPGTMHRDSCVGENGTFFTLSVSDRRFGSIDAAALPERATALSSGRAVRLARRIARACRCWPPRSTLRVERLCHELLSGLADDAGTRAPRPPGWLVAVRDTLSGRAAEAWSVRDLAASAGVHPVHLIRSFRRFFGRTPGEYLRARRLEAAASLLRTTGLPIVEVALRTGFADQSHMTRAFTRRFSVPPAAYRRGARPALPARNPG